VGVLRSTPLRCQCLAIVAAMASLDDDAHVTRSVDANERSRRVVHDVLNDLNLDYLPSYTSFLMHRIKGDLQTYISRRRTRGSMLDGRFRRCSSITGCLLAMSKRWNGLQVYSETSANAVGSSAACSFLTPIDVRGWIDCSIQPPGKL
jgi:hypothetical protein